MNTTKPTVSGEILSQPINDAFSQFIDNDIELQSNIDVVQSNLTTHINDQTDAHGSNAINNESSVNGDTVTNALETVQQQVNALVVGGVTNTTIGVYSLNLTGSVNAYVATFAGLTYFGGLKLNATVNIANTGASTINLNGLGIKNVKKKTALGTKTDLIGGDMPLGNIVQLEYDGVDFILLQEVKTVTQYNLTIDPSNQVKSVTDSTDGIADVEVGGATLNNALTNGDFANGTTGWASVSVASFSASANVGTFTANAQGGNISKPNPVKNGQKWFYRGEIKANSNLVRFRMAGFATKNHTGSGQFEVMSILQTATVDFGANLQIDDQRTSGWSPVQVKNCMTVNVSALGLESLTESQLNFMTNKYFEGFAGSTEFTLESAALNLFDGELELGIYDGSTGNKINSTNSVRSKNKINVKRSTTYKITGMPVSSGDKYLFRYAKNGQFLGNVYIGTGATTSYTLSVPSDTDAVSFEFIGYTTLANQVMFSEGSDTKPYQAPKGRKLTVKGFTRHKVGGVQDWFMQKRGYTWAVKNIKELTISASNLSGFTNSPTNLNAIKLTLPADSVNVALSGKFMLQNYPEGSGALDQATNVNKTLVDDSAARRIWVAFDKTAVPNQAAAEAELVGKKVLCQLATPQYIPFEDFGTNGIETTGVVGSFSGYTHIALTSLDITPDLTYTYSMDYGASIYTLKENTSTALELAKTAINMIDQPWQSWTPTVTWTTANPITPTIVSRYKQIGTTVHFNLWITSTNGNGATDVTISLPVSPKNNSTTISLNSQEKVNTTWTSPMGRIVDSTSNITFVSFSVATSAQPFELLVSGSYEVL